MHLQLQIVAICLSEASNLEMVFIAREKEIYSTLIYCFSDYAFAIISIDSLGKS